MNDGWELRELDEPLINSNEKDFINIKQEYIRLINFCFNCFETINFNRGFETETIKEFKNKLSEKELDFKNRFEE